MELYKTTDLEIVDKNIDQIISSIEDIKKELYPVDKNNKSNANSKPETIDDKSNSDSKSNVDNKELVPKQKTFKDVEDIVNITLEFVSSKKRKIYGGYAQNKTVVHKNKKDAFYSEEDAPDIDVYSPQPIEDLVELCDMLHAKGYNVNGMEAIHEGTYKIFANGYNAIDLSYVPKMIFDAIPFIEINNIRYVHPFFAMIDLYRMLSEPLFSSWRWKKAINRLHLLQKYYPFEYIKNKSIDNPYKHKTNVSKAMNIILNFIKNNENVYVVGDFAYNQLVKESGDKNFSEIDVGIYQIISIDYKKDAKALINKFKESGINIKIVEYYPFFNFTGYSVEIMHNGKTIAKIYNNLKRCCPVKKINTSDNSVVQIGSFDFIFLMEMVFSFRQKVLKDNNKKRYHDSLISNMIKMRENYFKTTGKTLLDDSLFQSFIGTCIGKGVDTFNEAKKKRKELKERKKKKEKVSFGFSYKPVREIKNKWIFSNVSGNLINNPKNLKLSK
jgi:hypothetical protein